MFLKSLPKRCSIVIVFFFLITNLSPIYAYQATVLSDKELDNLCVGGFEFNLNAAYAFRAAIVSQTNIASIVAMNNVNQTNINATNQTLIKNQGNSALASQTNISTVFAHIGNIATAAIKNMNLADVSNIAIEAGAATVTSLSASDSALPVADPTPLEASNSLAADPTPAIEITPEIPNLTDLVEPEVVINEVELENSAAVAQTNIAAVMAPNGNIDDVNIANLNIAHVNNVGNAALSAQTNIAIVLAGGTIGNSDIVNSSIANVVNTNATEAGGASVTPVSFTQVIGNNPGNQILVQSNALAAQVNITFVKSMMKDLKDTLTKEIVQKLVIPGF
jgi:hypothetical protein